MRCRAERRSNQPLASPPASFPNPSKIESEFHKARVLLAEDNFINQKITLAQLLRLRYRADSAANGREVLEALQRISYDLILMDCQMPEMDGYETSQAIRQREKSSHWSVGRSGNPRESGPHLRRPAQDCRLSKTSVDAMFTFAGTLNSPMTNLGDRLLDRLSRQVYLLRRHTEG